MRGHDPPVEISSTDGSAYCSYIFPAIYEAIALLALLRTPFI